MQILVMLIQSAYWIYNYMIIAYILLSWVPALKSTPLGVFLERVVEPYLQPFRKLIPSMGMLDISPIAALITLYFAKEGILFLLRLFIS